MNVSNELRIRLEEVANTIDRSSAAQPAEDATSMAATSRSKRSRGTETEEDKRDLKESSELIQQINSNTGTV